MRANYSNRNISERDKDVLRLVWLSDKNIADTLCLSISTVKTHLNRINNALVTNTRTEALIKALKKGLIKLEEIEVE